MGGVRPSPPGPFPGCVAYMGLRKERWRWRVRVWVCRWCARANMAGNGGRRCACSSRIRSAAVLSIADVRFAASSASAAVRSLSASADLTSALASAILHVPVLLELQQLLVVLFALRRHLIPTGEWMRVA